MGCPRVPLPPASPLVTLRVALLPQGMAITIEPGLYFPADDPDLPEWCRGIGIRIEDDLLISAPGNAPEVLTADAPKDAAEMEALLCS